MIIDDNILNEFEGNNIIIKNNIHNNNINLIFKMNISLLYEYSEKNNYPIHFSLIYYIIRSLNRILRKDESFKNYLLIFNIIDELNPFKFYKIIYDNDIKFFIENIQKNCYNELCLELFNNDKNNYNIYMMTLPSIYYSIFTHPFFTNNSNLLYINIVLGDIIKKNDGVIISNSTTIRSGSVKEKKMIDYILRLDEIISEDIFLNEVIL